MEKMSFNYDKLNGRIVEKCGKQSVFASMMGLSEHTISVKLNNKVSFKQEEILKACRVLSIPNKDIPAYFFAIDVQ